MQLRHHVGGLGHGINDVVGERGGVRAGEPDPFQAFNVPAGPEELGEGLPVAELHTVGVDVLAQEGDFDGAVVHQRLDLGKDVSGPAVFLLSAEGGHDAEGAGVVAADGDGYPA